MKPADAASWRPARPNMLVTGTPGTGKTTVAAAVANELGLRHVDVGLFARERDLVESYDERLDCHVLHMDSVLDALEPIMTTGGVVLDHHSSDWFPERWFQAVVVLRTNTAPLYDRLEARGYSRFKLDHNMQAEIMQVVCDEARTAYANVPFLELWNDRWEQRDAVVAAVRKHYKALLKREELPP